MEAEDQSAVPHVFTQVMLVVHALQDLALIKV